jgi:hypothetical protein
MTDMIESIVREWSRRIPSGIIDLQNEDHKLLLLQVLNEHIDDTVVIDEVMKNIFENK